MYRKFRVLTVAILALALVTFAACGDDNEDGSPTPAESPQSTSKPAPDKVTLGANMDLTGPASDLGKQMHNGLKLAVKEVNAAGGVGGAEFAVRVEDNKFDVPTSVNIFRGMQSDGLPLVFGFGTGPVTAQLPLAGELKTMFVNNSANGPGLRQLAIDEGNGYYFSATPYADLGNDTLGVYAAEKLGAKTVVTFAWNTGYGKGAEAVFVKGFESAGGKVLDRISFDPAATDLRPELNRAKSLNPDAIYIVGGGAAPITVISQGTQAGLDVQYLADSPAVSSAVLSGLGELAEGLVAFSFPFPSAGTPAMKTFAEAYKAEYGEEPSNFAAIWYDSVKLAAKFIGELIDEGQEVTPDTLREKYASLTTYEGAGGTISFESDGSGALKPYPEGFPIVQVKDGAFVNVE